jgi:hypothetical protein
VLIAPKNNDPNFVPRQDIADIEEEHEPTDVEEDVSTNENVNDTPETLDEDNDDDYSLHYHSDDDMDEDNSAVMFKPFLTNGVPPPRVCMAYAYMNGKLYM